MGEASAKAEKTLQKECHGNCETCKGPGGLDCLTCAGHMKLTGAPPAQCIPKRRPTTTTTTTTSTTTTTTPIPTQKESGMAEAEVVAARAQLKAVKALAKAQTISEQLVAAAAEAAKKKCPEGSPLTDFCLQTIAKAEKMANEVIAKANAKAKEDIAKAKGAFEDKKKEAQAKAKEAVAKAKAKAKKAVAKAKQRELMDKLKAKLKIPSFPKIR